MAPRERERSLGGGCAAGGAAGAALLHGLVHLPAGDPHRPVRCRRTSQQPGCAGARQEPTSPTASSLQETSQPTSQPNTRQQGNKHSTGRTQRRRPWWGSQRRPAGEGSGVMRGGSRGGGGGEGQRREPQRRTAAQQFAQLVDSWRAAPCLEQRQGRRHDGQVTCPRRRPRGAACTSPTRCQSRPAAGGPCRRRCSAQSCRCKQRRRW